MAAACQSIPNLRELLTDVSLIQREYTYIDRQMKEDMMGDLSLTIHFTFFHTDPEYPEANMNWSIAHDIAGILSEHGYSVKPVFPGDCGRYKFEVLQEIEGTLNDNRDLITSFAELLNPVVTYFLDR